MQMVDMTLIDIVSRFTFGDLWDKINDKSIGILPEMVLYLMLFLFVEFMQMVEMTLMDIVSRFTFGDLRDTINDKTIGSLPKMVCIMLISFC